MQAHSFKGNLRKGPFTRNWAWKGVKLGSNDLGPNMKMTQDEMLYAMHMKTYKNYNYMCDPKLFKRSRYYLTWSEPPLIYLNPS